MTYLSLQRTKTLRGLESHDMNVPCCTLFSFQIPMEKASGGDLCSQWWGLGLFPAACCSQRTSLQFWWVKRNYTLAPPNPHPSWWCDGFRCSSLNLDSLRSLTTEKFAIATPNTNGKYCAKQVVQHTLTAKTAKQSVPWNHLCEAEKVTTPKLLFGLVLQEINSIFFFLLHKLTTSI